MLIACEIPGVCSVKNVFRRTWRTHSSTDTDACRRTNGWREAVASPIGSILVFPDLSPLRDVSPRFPLSSDLAISVWSRDPSVRPYLFGIRASGTDERTDRYHNRR
jgi:hypothetical protein